MKKLLLLFVPLIFGNPFMALSNTALADIIGSTEVCEDATETYSTTVFQNAIYEWSVSGGNILSDNEMGEILIAWDTIGIALITVQIMLPDSSIQVGQLTVNIHENILEVASAEVTQSCDANIGGAIDLTVVGNGPFQFSWSTGATSKDLDNLDPGIYEFTISDVFGCNLEAVYIIEAGPIVSIAFTIIESCEGPVVLPNLEVDGTIICGFEWDTDTVSTSGTYNYLVTFCDGCTSSGSISVTVSPPIQLSLDVIDPSPGQSDGAITANILGGAPPFMVIWANGSTGSTISNLPAGNYSVTVIDANGCVAFETITIGNPSSATTLNGFSQFLVKPNPISDYFELEFSIPNAVEIEIYAIDATGKNMGIVLNKNYVRPGLFNYKHNTENWPKGVYFMVTEVDGVRGYWRLVKQ